MLFLILLVFAGVFLVVTMLLMAGTTGRSQQAKQTLANLESALATASQQARDQIVVQQSRLSDGTRKVTSISEITGMEGDVITMQEIFL
ncbi:MAG TPA: hypothetical protein VJU82_17160, partial [Acidobacteriaceae bacterium]|nr:hypothetical protein [Acidobacteriaceae bacterium]